MISVHRYGEVLDRHEIYQGDNFGIQVRETMVENCGYTELNN